MADQRENAIINVVINGQQAISTFKQLNAERAKQLALVQNLDRNAPNYAEQRQRLEELTAATREWRNELTSGAQQSKGFFASFKDGFAEMAGNVTAATLVFKAVGAGIDAIKNIWNGSEAAFKEAEQNQAQLAAVLKSTAGAAGLSQEALNDLSTAVMNKTGVDDDAITKSEALLLTFTNIHDQIFEESIPAILDMSKALGTDLEGATIQVGKALNNPIAGLTALKKVGVSFTEQQKEQIITMQKAGDMMGAQKIILGELTKEFGGVAEAIRNTDSGKLEAFETRIGNIQESIGKWITKGKSLALDVLSPFITFIERVTSSKLSEDLEDERIEMNLLVLKITDANTQQSERVKLIEKLKGMYPQLLKDLDAEKSSNEQVAKAADLVNKTYIDRIVLAKKDEEIEQQNQRAAELKIKMLEAEQKLREAIVKLHYSRPDLNLPTEGTAEEKITAMLQQAQRMKANGGLAGGGIFDPTFQAGKALREFQALMEFADNASKKSDKMLKARQELMKELGIDETFKGVTPPETPAAAYTSGGTTDDEKAKAKQERDAYIAGVVALNAELSEFNAERITDTMTANDKEVAELRAKYDKEIAITQAQLKKLRENKNANNAELDKIEAKIGELDGAKTKAVGDLRVKQDKEMVEKIMAFRDQLSGKLKTELDKETDLINQKYDDLAAAGVDEEQQFYLDVQRAKELADAKIREEKRWADEKINISQDLATDDADKIASEKAGINKKFDDQIAALKKNYSEQLRETQDFKDQMAIIEAGRERALSGVGKPKPLTPEEMAKRQQDISASLKQGAINAAQSVSDAVFEIGAQNRQRELDMKLSALEKEKEAELKNKNLTETQKNSINEKYAKKEADLKLKSWKAEKEAKMLQAVINGALAVTMALSSGIAPFNFIAAGVVGVATAAQLAVIANSKPPKFEQGGFVPNGERHTQGGINLVGPYGQIYGNVEGGEPILSRDTYANNKGVVDMLLSSNGKQLSYDRVLQATSAREARRTYSSGTGVTGGGGASSSSNGLVAVVGQQNSRLDQIERILERQAAINELPVVWSDKIMQERQARNVTIRDSAGV
ncbi:MAG: hypothetical protein V4619_09180 [Bacteroidota bacterium]